MTAACSPMAVHGTRMVDNGWSILPIMPGHKRPGRLSEGRWVGYARWAQHCGRPNTEFEAPVWSQWPDCGVGIACGRTVAVDIDIEDAGRAHALTALARRMLGDTPLVRYGQRPKTLLVYRADRPLGGRKHHPVEVIGRGQQFVAWHTHPGTNRPYEWPDDNPTDTPLADLPVVDDAKIDAFLAAADALIPEDQKPGRLAGDRDAAVSAEARGTIEAIADALTYIPNPDLGWDDWKRIMMAVHAAVGDAGYDAFRDWSATSPKHDQQHFERQWAGLRHSPPTRIGAGTIYWQAEQHGWRPPPEIILNGAVADMMRREGFKPIAAEAQAPASVAPFDGDLLRVDGVLGNLMDLILRSAVRPQPELALAAALCAVGVLTARRYRTPTGLRGNLYMVGLAPSGSGKDHARKCVKEVLTRAGLDRYLGGDEIASGAGMISALEKHPAKLFMLDEFGHVVASMAGPKAAPHRKAILSKLTELFTSADGVYLGTEYADQRDRPRRAINQPCVCLYGTTVAETLWTALGSGNTLDGSLARIMAIETREPYPRRNPAPASRDPSEALIGRLQAIASGKPGHSPGGNLAGGMAPVAAAVPYTVPFDADGGGAWESIQDEQDDWLRADADAASRAAVARLAEHTVKLAMIRAVSRNPADPVIDGRLMAWARALALHCVSFMVKAAVEHIADSDAERDKNRLVAVIEKAGSEGIDGHKLNRKSQWIKNAKERNELLTDLIEADRVIAEKKERAGRPGHRYWTPANCIMQLGTDNAVREGCK